MSALGTLGLSVALVAVFVSIEARAKHLLVPLGVFRSLELVGSGLVVRVGADPTSASLERASHRETTRYLAEHGPGDDRPQGHPFSKSEFFGQPLPTEVITALTDNLEEKRVPGQSRGLDFTPWGGPYNRVRADATAFVHRDELFLIQHSVVVDPDVSATEREAARSWLARSWAIVRPWGSERAYQNFPDPDLEDSAHAYYEINNDRPVRIKSQYDPEDFFRFPQSISSRDPGSGPPV